MPANTHLQHATSLGSGGRRAGGDGARKGDTHLLSIWERRTEQIMRCPGAEPGTPPANTHAYVPTSDTEPGDVHQRSRRRCSPAHTHHTHTHTHTARSTHTCALSTHAAGLVDGQTPVMCKREAAGKQMYSVRSSNLEDQPSSGKEKKKKKKKEKKKNRRSLALWERFLAGRPGSQKSGTTPAAIGGPSGISAHVHVRMASCKTSPPARLPCRPAASR